MAMLYITYAKNVFITIPPNQRADMNCIICFIATLSLNLYRFVSL